MNVKALTFFTATALSVGAVSAAPVSAISGLEFHHDIIVNSGNVPTGIEINYAPPSFSQTVGATSSVDDPAAIPTNSSSATVGHQFSDPIVPYNAQRVNRTMLPGNLEGAESRYNVTIAVTGATSPNIAQMVERDTLLIGAARLDFDDQIQAEAESFHNVERRYVFENTTNNLISFNVVGEIEAALFAGYDGTDGFARSAGRVFAFWENGVGASVNYLPLSPYLFNSDDSDPGTENIETLVADDAGIEFAASASAVGTGIDALATFDMSHRYFFGISLAPGGSLELSTGFNQINSVNSTPLPAPVVPLPASLPFLSVALIGFAALRRRQKAA